MNENLLVLIIEKEVAKALRSAKTRHFRATGDHSVYLLPEVFILGVWNKRRFDRRTLQLPLEFAEYAEESDNGYLLPLKESSVLEPLKAELGISSQPSGLYVSRKLRPERITIPASAHQRLALLSYEGEGYILLQ